LRGIAFEALIVRVSGRNSHPLFGVNLSRIGRLNRRVARHAPQAIGHPLAPRSRAEFGRHFAA
jgi:hypothetical protein